LSFIAAFRFLTIIPLWRSREFTVLQMGKSTAWFPLIGLLIGLASGILAWALSFILPQLIVVLLTITFTVLVTGAMHLDGLADTCDGLGGSSPAARLEIMKDSRTGAFGVIGIVTALLFKIALLNSLPKMYLLFTLLVMPVLGRWIMALALFSFPYARPAGTGKAFKDNIRWQDILLASLTALVVSIGIGRFAGAASVLSVLLIGLTVAWLLHRQLKGLTGDVYGALNEIAEITMLLVINVLVYNQWLLPFKG
jgi:adenosylcobinamide-GDP ribazoletransferase